VSELNFFVMTKNELSKSEKSLWLIVNREMGNVCPCGKTGNGNLTHHGCHGNKVCECTNTFIVSEPRTESVTETYEERLQIEPNSAVNESKIRYDRVLRTGSRTTYRTVSTPKWVPTYCPGTGGGYTIYDSSIVSERVPYEYYEDVPIPTTSTRTVPGTYRTQTKSRDVTVTKYERSYVTKKCECLGCRCWKCSMTIGVI
jgi:hypothetical protein